jgi:hypothetical protein
MSKNKKPQGNIFPALEFVTVTDELPWMMKSEYKNLTTEQKTIAILKGVQCLDKPFRSELSKKTRVRPNDL